MGSIPLLLVVLALACGSSTDDEVAAVAAVPRTFHVAPDGDDDDPGSAALPWRTLGRSLPALRAGDTLVLHTGTYFEGDLVLERSGSAERPITLRSAPGERAVLDGGYREFRQAGNSDWELVDAGRQLWRSTKTKPRPLHVYGFLGADDGGWRLVPYEAPEPLASDNEDYTDRAPFYYIGPGVHWNAADQRIHYRSQHSRYQSAPEHAVPRHADPRVTPMVLFGEGHVLHVRGSHIVLEGLVIRHREIGVQIDGRAHHVTLRDVDVLGGRYSVLVRDGAHDLVMQGLTIADRFPPWVAWTDVKRPRDGRPGHLLQGAGIALSDAIDNVEISGCTLTGLFDAIGAGQSPSRLSVHHNLFDVRDDVLQLGTAAWEIEFAHNRVLAAHSAGPAWNGSGAPPDDQIGTVYIHHNVLDATTPGRFGRADPLGLLGRKYQGPAGDGLATGRIFGRHSLRADSGPAPWKIYHNTCLVGADVDNGGAGHTYRLPLFDTDSPHEVYNNVFVQLGDQWVARHGRTDDGSAILDGNLYWAPGRGDRTDLFEDLVTAGREQDWPNLRAFVGSPAWEATRAHYAPGWESSGTEADPQLDAELRPAANSPAASGAVDLSAKAWPGLRGEVHRGALAPR